MKCPTKPDLPPNLLSLSLPLLPLDLPLLSSVGGGRRRVGGGREREGRRKEGGQKREGDWIDGNDGLGKATVRERVRERGERVRELKSKIDYEGRREWVLINE